MPGRVSVVRRAPRLVMRAVPWLRRGVALSMLARGLQPAPGRRANPCFAGGTPASGTLTLDFFSAAPTLC